MYKCNQEYDNSGQAFEADIDAITEVDRDEADDEDDE